MASHLSPNTDECKSLKIKQACVFGGRNMGRKESYKNAAVELGKELVSRHMGLVYGGETDGLIGLVAQTVHDAGCDVLGFTVEALRSDETIEKLKIVSSLHQRKMEIIHHADCFIALPGGYEAMEGLTEVLSWAQLRIHDKPIGLINIDGYFDDFMAFIDKAIEDGFVKLSQKELIVQSTDAVELFKMLKITNLLVKEHFLKNCGKLGNYSASIIINIKIHRRKG